MNNRIPTSTSDPSYIGAIAEPAALDAQAVSQGPRIVDARPATGRTRAPHRGEREAASVRPSLDLDMHLQLISPAAYRDATRGGASFRAATRALKSVLVDHKTALQQRASTAQSADAARTMQAAKALEAAEALVGEICDHGDTLAIYIDFAPKMG
ncbi:hypothetical protein [Achromobacter aloeverae]